MNAVQDVHAKFIARVVLIHTDPLPRMDVGKQCVGEGQSSVQLAVRGPASNP
jgi:hypothetical protein